MKQKKDLKNVLSGSINTPDLLAKELKRRKSKRKRVRGTPLKKSDRKGYLKKQIPNAIYVDKNSQLLFFRPIMSGHIYREVKVI